MRTRTYTRDEDGTLRPGWSENSPGGYARIPGHRGELVVGEPGAEEKNKAMQRAAMARLRATRKEPPPPIPPDPPKGRWPIPDPPGWKWEPRRGKAWFSDEERRAARRASWRAYQQRTAAQKREAA